jgi:Flp pilus assembly protein TadG
MRIRTRKHQSRRAMAVVEAALVLPLLFILLFGVWETSRMIEVSQAVSNSAREGARQASAGQPASNVGLAGGQTAYSTQNYVAYYLMNANLPAPVKRPFYVKVTNMTQTGTPSCTVQCLYSAPPNGNLPYNLSITLYGAAPSVDPVLSAARNDILAVKVTYPFDESRWSPVNTYVFFGNWDLSDTAYWPCMIDVPVSINATIPSQPQ